MVSSLLDTRACECVNSHHNRPGYLFFFSGRGMGGRVLFFPGNERLQWLLPLAPLTMQSRAGRAGQVRSVCGEVKAVIGGCILFFC